MERQTRQDATDRDLASRLKAVKDPTDRLLLAYSHAAQRTIASTIDDYDESLLEQLLQAARPDLASLSPRERRHRIDSELPRVFAARATKLKIPTEDLSEPSVGRDLLGRKRIKLTKRTGWKLAERPSVCVLTSGVLCPVVSDWRTMTLTTSSLTPRALIRMADLLKLR